MVEISIESDLLSEPYEPKGAQYEDQEANARRGQEAKRGNEHLAEEQNQKHKELAKANSKKILFKKYSLLDQAFVLRKASPEKPAE